ncbi:MAG: NUDIX hydrolase [Planctomycetota bacterium]|nr:NUDIX hydrolase [Planctomycetota bacterium]
MVQFTTQKSKQLYRGKRVNLFCDEVQIDGKNFVREVVRLRPAAAALPIVRSTDGSEKIIMVRQFRYPVRLEMLEIPAGVIEEGETPETCIKRELKEEIGYSAKTLKHLATIHPSPGVLDEVLHIFVAKGLLKTIAKQDADENITSVVEIPLTDGLQMIKNNTITDAKTIIAILLYAQSRAPNKKASYK